MTTARPAPATGRLARRPGTWTSRRATIRGRWLSTPGSSLHTRTSGTRPSPAPTPATRTGTRPSPAPTPTTRTRTPPRPAPPPPPRTAPPAQPGPPPSHQDWDPAQPGPHPSHQDWDPAQPGPHPSHQDWDPAQPGPHPRHQDLGPAPPRPHPSHPERGPAQPGPHPSHQDWDPAQPGPHPSHQDWDPAQPGPYPSHQELGPGGPVPQVVHPGRPEPDFPGRWPGQWRGNPRPDDVPPDRAPPGWAPGGPAAAAWPPAQPGPPAWEPPQAPPPAWEPPQAPPPAWQPPQAPPPTWQPPHQAPPSWTPPEPPPGSLWPGAVPPDMPLSKPSAGDPVPPGPLLPPGAAPRSARGAHSPPGPGAGHTARPSVAPRGHGTRRPASPGTGGAAYPVAESAVSPSLVRSSGVMALGTLASRVTGLLRTLVLVPAIGQLALANSYNYANTLPNTVYNLAIGGILTSVIVPLLVNAARRDADRGEKYDQRMFTLVTLALAVITLAATIAAAPIARLYDPSATGNAERILVIFAYFFTPQIFFYGVSSLAGAILNARGHFAAPMWTPVVNNVVVIVVTVAFMAIAGLRQTVNTITTFEVVFLGVGTTLGIVAQTVALIPALRSVGFRWRPRFDFRRGEIAEIGRMSGWMFCYVLTTQVAFLVTAMVASTAGNSAQTHGVGAGFSAYSYAWLLFQLPYAVIAISVITALLPRMSANAADGRYDLLRVDFSVGTRLGSVIVAPAALVLAVLGPSLGEVMFGWGNNSDASARYLGLVFSVFSLGLMPYMLFQLLLRVFYSLHDSKTAALIGVATMFTNVGANLAALELFPKSSVVAALGAGFGLANLVGTVIAWRVLSRRLGGLSGWHIVRSLVRMHVAAVPAALAALVVAAAVARAIPAGKVAAGTTVIVGGGAAVVLYVILARALRVVEVSDLIGALRSRLRR